MIGLTAVSPADANTEEVATWRQRVAVWVALAPGQPASYLVRGEPYATDDELLPGTTVQLLIHGGIYNHDYGDLDRVDGVPYSYALEVAARGFPMFALDLLGSAHSSHLSRNQLTIQATAYIVHQIVQGLRDGSITGVEFGKVITVSPSVGSAIVWQEAISYGDVDGVIMTGVTHSRSRRFRELAKNDGYQAVDNPKLVASCLDAGYLTTVPGRRATIRVPFLAILVGSNGAPTSGPNRQGTNLDCRSDAVVATLEAPFDSQWAWIPCVRASRLGSRGQPGREPQASGGDRCCLVLSLCGSVSLRREARLRRPRQKRELSSAERRSFLELRHRFYRVEVDKHHSSARLCHPDPASGERDPSFFQQEIARWLRSCEKISGHRPNGAPPLAVRKAGGSPAKQLNPKEFNFRTPDIGRLGVRIPCVCWDRRVLIVASAFRTPEYPIREPDA